MKKTAGSGLGSCCVYLWVSSWVFDSVTVRQMGGRAQGSRWMWEWGMHP